MNTTQIADMIRRAPVLSTEFQEAAAALMEYATAKRATGAPTVLEYHLHECMMDAERAVRCAREACRRVAERASREVADMDTAHGGPGSGWGWSPREDMGGQNTDDPVVRVEVARIRCEALRQAVELWAALADRIVATPEDVQRHAQEQRARRIDAWLAKPVRETRAAAKAAGLKVGTDRVNIATALAAAGVDP